MTADRAAPVQEQLLPGGTLRRSARSRPRSASTASNCAARATSPSPRRLPELRRARAAGVVMPTVCVEMLHFIGDFDADRRRDAIAQLTLPALGHRRDRRRRRDDPGLLRDVLPPAAAVRAAAHRRSRTGRCSSTPSASSASTPRAEGVSLFLEPLNRYEDHMVNRLDEAVALCDAVGLASVRLVRRHLPP